MLEKALISFSFDDGREDNYTIALPILKKYGLPATFNITAAYVEGKIEKDLPTDVPAMNVGMVTDIYSSPLFEIAGHGYYHFNDKENILRGIDELKKLCGVARLTSFGNGFASPGTDLELKTWNEVRDKISYARLSLRYKKYAKISIFLRKLSRVFQWPLFYRLAYKDTLMDSVENGLIYSIPVLSSTTVSQLTAILEYAINQRKACVLMLHSIVPVGEIHDNWDYEVDNFEILCQWIYKKQNEGCLQAETTMNVYQQLKRE